MKDSATSPSWQLSLRQKNDLEALLLGALFPVIDYMCREDCDSVLRTNRLKNGELWPHPIALDVTRSFADTFQIGGEIILLDLEGVALAALQVGEFWDADRISASRDLPSTEASNATLYPLSERTLPVRVGGLLRPITPPVHYDFLEFRRPPDRMRRATASRPLLAIAARGGLHRADVESIRRVLDRLDANLMIIALSSALDSDIDFPARMRCYRHLLSEFPPGRAELVLTPAISRGVGIGCELLHLLMARNYGSTHYMTDLRRTDQNYAELETYGAELGMGIVPAEQLIFSKRQGSYIPVDSLSPGEEVGDFGPADLQACLDLGGAVPDWYTYPEVLAELRQAHPPRGRRGFTVFFTGLSGAGKSTLANALVARLNERGGRRVSLLDGDVVRTHLSSELGFSKEHRDLNVQRISYVASEVTKHGGIAVCAPIAPYAETRGKVRRMIEAVGGFIEVYVATPLDVCESRDRKGLYAKARAGLIKGFTGVDDPYEAPTKAEVTIDTRFASPAQAIDLIIDHLEAVGYLSTTS